MTSKSSQHKTKRIYLREHSTVIRRWANLESEMNNMHETSMLHVEGDARTILVTICRIRQRLLQQAWNLWITNANIIHDYEADVRKILSRKIPDNSLRTELEIEVLFKWVTQTKDLDPTGISSTIYMCKKKASVYAALQQLRLEFYSDNETVLFQGDFPKSEDGHFTILKGECEVLQFEDDSVPLLSLLYNAKRKKWDEAKEILKSAKILAKIPKLSGFGELSTLTNVQRAATIRASPIPGMITEILVLPKEALLDCLKFRRNNSSSSTNNNTASEAIDFMRQSGLANRISPKDLVHAASSMIRRTLLRGDILFCKGEEAKSIFLVVSGEFVLDIGEVVNDGKIKPFSESIIENCYYLSSGSILGDEGIITRNNIFHSTAVVVSDAAVVFEAVDFGLSFLAERIGALRYCALVYRDKSRWSAPVSLAEQVNPYTFFNSLRKTIAFIHPYRGSTITQVDNHEISNAEKIKMSIKSKQNIVSNEKNHHNSNNNINNKSKKNNNSNNRVSARMQALLEQAALFENFSSDGLNDDTSHHSMFVIGDDGIEYPRKLETTSLHRAVEIGKIAKKLLQHYMKIHAKESILLDQLMKLPSEEKGKAESKFKKALADYRYREVQKANEIAEMEAKKYTTSSGKAVSLFAASSTRTVSHKRTSQSNKHNDEESLSSVGSTQKITVKFDNYDEDELGSLIEKANKMKEKQDAESRIRAFLSDDVGDTFEVVVDSVANATLESITKIPLQPLPTQVIINRTESEAIKELKNMPKMDQYYVWLDHLTLARYADIEKQAKETMDQQSNIDLLLHKHIHMSDHYLQEAHNTDTNTSSHMHHDLGNIIIKYGLTP
eukprot:gene13456-18048_t